MRRTHRISPHRSGLPVLISGILRSYVHYMFQLLKLQPRLDLAALRGGNRALPFRRVTLDRINARWQ